MPYNEALLVETIAESLGRLEPGQDAIVEWLGRITVALETQNRLLDTIAAAAAYQVFGGYVSPLAGSGMTGTTDAGRG